MKIAIVSTTTKATEDDVATMTLAVAGAAVRDFAPAWNLLNLEIGFVPSGGSVAAADVVIAVADTLDDPNALGYHTINSQGKKTGIIGLVPILDNGGALLVGDETHPTGASVLAHEVYEAAIDPYCNGWSERADGILVAQEVGDPVECDGYNVAVRRAGSDAPVDVWVSSFVFPEWFDAMSPTGTKVDFMGRLSAPFTMTAGGYMILRDKTGATSQVFGEKYPEWRKAQARARRVRRGVVIV